VSLGVALEITSAIATGAVVLLFLKELLHTFVGFQVVVARGRERWRQRPRHQDEYEGREYNAPHGKPLCFEWCSASGTKPILLVELR
jgi:hypothetical protein